ncbi:MAG: tyrosine-type recombinase/integrase [Homoserinimonas sp.]
MINKTAQGNFRVRVKHKGKVVADKTFQRKGDAVTWESAMKRRIALGDWIDPRLGEEPLSDIATRWLEMRQKTVAGKTYQTDELMLRLHLSKNITRMPISSITVADIEDELLAASAKIARSSVVRFRAVLSALFEWAVRQRIVRTNVVKEAAVPLGTGVEEVAEVHPFTKAELFEVYDDLKTAGGKWADLALVLGITGLRWGELMALRPRDIQNVPYPAIRVSRSAPDGQPIRNTTKGGTARTVPLAEDLLPIFQDWMKGLRPNDLIFANAAGNRTGNKNWTRKVNWKKLNRGRRIHDLRHTAATLWLSSSVDPKTVQTWLGHASMTLTVDLYAHFMGQDADLAAINRINAALRETPRVPKIRRVDGNDR